MAILSGAVGLLIAPFLIWSSRVPFHEVVADIFFQDGFEKLQQSLRSTDANPVFKRQLVSALRWRQGWLPDHYGIDDGLLVTAAPFASDAAIGTCRRALYAFRQAAVTDPRLCALSIRYWHYDLDFDAHASQSLTQPQLSLAYTAYRDACDAAYADGIDQQRLRSLPSVLSTTVSEPINAGKSTAQDSPRALARSLPARRSAARAFERAADGSTGPIVEPNIMRPEDQEAIFEDRKSSPVPFTPDERATYPSGDDALVCGASNKLQDNLLQLPSDTLARYWRTLDRIEFEPGVRIRLPAAPDDAPDDLRCATPGTKFTLSREGRDGRPITWVSRGRRGWDCEVETSDGGIRPMLGSGGDGVLRSLWPLPPGRVASRIDDLGSGLNREVRMSAAASAPLQLAFGKLDAIAIEQEVRVEGWQHYRTTFYWCPSLGAIVGQHTQVLSGFPPALLPPDWQVVAITSALH